MKNEKIFPEEWDKGFYHPMVAPEIYTDALIAEQIHTRQLLKKLKKAGVFKKFLEDVEPAEESLSGAHFEADPWDYEALKSEETWHIQEEVRKLFDAARALKFYLNYIDKLYEERGLEAIKAAQTNPEYYPNPVCLKFFKDYEKDNKDAPKDKEGCII